MAALEVLGGKKRKEGRVGGQTREHSGGTRKITTGVGSMKRWAQQQGQAQHDACGLCYEIKLLRAAPSASAPRLEGWINAGHWAPARVGNRPREGGWVGAAQAATGVTGAQAANAKSAARERVKGHPQAQ